MKKIILSYLAISALSGCGGEGSTSNTVTPAVDTPANLAPILASVNANQTAILGTPFSYDATQSSTTFTDADNDTLTYTISYAPAAQGLSDNAGVISGTPSVEGTVTISISANDGNGGTVSDTFDIVIASETAVTVKFGERLDLNNLENYANQVVPNYITKLNTNGNPITDAGATLGRVLFFDKTLSVDDTISCSSCHFQSHGFSDPEIVSTGAEGGLTGRHSMRLINTQFADETNFFWDERANSQEAQETQPLQDHNEHGFSGEGGRPSFADLVTKLEATDYYQELFTFTFGDAEITEERLQLALAQFVKSIQSFDSKFDTGRAQVNNNGADFPNFTADENAGKTLFLDNSNQGGAGCQACHRAPEFDIRPGSNHNGMFNVANSTIEFDLTNTRSPSLRDLSKPDGSPNGPFMHDGSLATLMDVVEHYNAVQAPATNPPLDDFLNTIDNRLLPNGNLQRLNLSDQEKDQLVAFLQTLTGSNIYTDEKLSNPFE